MAVAQPTGASSVSRVPLDEAISAGLAEARTLLSAGHVLAGAAVLRSTLENWARSRAHDFGGLGARSQRSHFWLLTAYLSGQGAITSSEKSRLKKVYWRTSNVVHGRSADFERLIAAVGEVGDIIAGTSPVAVR